MKCDSTPTHEILSLRQSLCTVMFAGGRLFHGWMGLLVLLLLAGLTAFIFQTREGLAVSNMRAQVSWGFYIGNFSFLVGVAAAAVLLVIPAYLYHFKAIKKIVAFGELLAVTAVLMSMLFLTVDTGRPERFWHALPPLGSLNLPRSILAWDILVLNGYLLLNLFSVGYVARSTYCGRPTNRRIIGALILVSIPLAVLVHSVTAFIFNGLAARPFWNASILAPRFLASAFCAGPAMMILIFQVLRLITVFDIRDTALFKLAEMVAYAMAINLFLLCAEVYKEYYSDTTSFAPMIYLFLGFEGHDNLVPWIWGGTGANIAGFLLLLAPKTRKSFATLNLGCVLVFLGIWVEKGMGLIIPGFVPDSLGEVYEYVPSPVEFTVGMGIWAFGALFYTLAVRVLIAIDTGKIRQRHAPALLPETAEGLVAGDIMSTKMVTVTPETPLDLIRSLLLTHRISGVPVVNAENQVLGVVSETDIVYSLLHLEPEVAERLKEIVFPGKNNLEKKTGATAAAVMTSPAITARPNTPLAEITETIAARRIKRVIIVDHEDHLLGIVTQIDIVKSHRG